MWYANRSRHTHSAQTENQFNWEIISAGTHLFCLSKCSVHTNYKCDRWKHRFVPSIHLIRSKAKLKKNTIKELKRKIKSDKISVVNRKLTMFNIYLRLFFSRRSYQQRYSFSCTCRLHFVENLHLFALCGDFRELMESIVCCDFGILWGTFLRCDHYVFFWSCLCVVIPLFILKTSSLVIIENGVICLLSFFRGAVCCVDIFDDSADLAKSLRIMCEYCEALLILHRVLHWVFQFLCFCFVSNAMCKLFVDCL